MTNELMARYAPKSCRKNITPPLNNPLNNKNRFSGVSKNLKRVRIERSAKISAGKIGYPYPPDEPRTRRVSIYAIKEFLCEVIFFAIR